MSARRQDRAQDGESISRVTARIQALLEEERVLIDRLADCRVKLPAPDGYRHPESNLLARRS